MQPITIQSSLEAMPHIEYLVGDICDELNLGALTATVTLAVVEAVYTAIVHGNHCDETKSVALAYGVRGGAVYFDVTDEGMSFSAQSEKTLTSGQSFNPDAEVFFCAAEERSQSTAKQGRGEGLFMMQSLADKLSYSQSSHTLHLEFNTTGIADTLAARRQSILATHYQTELLVL